MTGGKTTAGWKRERSAPLSASKLDSIMISNMFLSAVITSDHSLLFTEGYTPAGAGDVKDANISLYS